MIRVALIGLSIALGIQTANAGCEPEFRGPLYIHTNKDDLNAAAECRRVPLCQRAATGEMVPCWSQRKIERTYRILKGKYTRDEIISWEMNEGKFKNARELADWILHGDR